jgi:hypothetical protein
MTIVLSANTPRVSYTVNQGATQTAFTVNFEFFDDADLNFYVDGTKKTLSTHYTVSGGNGSTGTINTTSGNTVTGASGGSTIVITRDIALARITDFPSSGSFQVATLNTELDRFTAIASDISDETTRSIQLADEDSAVSMVLPLLASRKGTVLGFNASTGAVEAGPTITAVQSLSAVTASINLLGTSAVLEDLGLLATSTVIEDMGLLATSGNITAMGLLGVSGVIEDMGILGTSAIVEDLGLLATSGNVTAMGLLGNSTTITAMGKLGNDTTIADMAILGTDAIVADMAQLANSTIIDDLAILANSTITDDMAILATSANVTAMGLLATSANVTAQGLLGTSGNVTAMGLLGTSTVIEDMGLLSASAVIEDMGILGTSANVTAMSNVSGAIANVNTVASNVTGVNSFADRYRIASSAPSSSLNVGDLYFDTSANELKVYKSSGWASAGSTVNGTSARFHYDIGSAVTSVTGNDASGNALAYDAGFIDVYVNGVRMSTADVTVTSGDTVTFASALASGDEVDIVAFGTFAVANIVSTGALNSGSITSGFGTINTGASAITTTGVGSFGSLDISGNIDVDGTTNLDVVDIDGAVNMATTALVTGVLTTTAVPLFNGGIDLPTVNTFIKGGGHNVVQVDSTKTYLYGGTGGVQFRTADNASGIVDITNNGIVTMPAQPAFLVRPASTQNNFAVGSEVVVVFGTEVFDRNADFASNTFTAPVTGLYQFNASLRLEGVDSASSYYYIDIRTSNRDYQFIFDPDFGQDNAYFTMVVSCLADMDAGDTADVAILQGSGTQQTDIMIQSHFSGYLVA